jgi:hypothetical protein
MNPFLAVIILLTILFIVYLLYGAICLIYWKVNGKNILFKKAETMI